jgi:phage gp29-like protein
MPDVKRTRKSTRGELGGTGRTFSARFEYSLATDEYLNTLKWPYDISIYNKMERSDAQIKATLLMMELPLRSTNWFIKPADNSSQAKKNAEFVEENLFTGPPVGMSLHFEDFIKETCSMFTYGHAIFEKVFEAKNGWLKWKKFAPRPQSTIYDWYYDEVGDLKEIEQELWQHSFKRVKMPIDKLLVFTHDMKQGDYRGRSVLRTTYKHWSIKDFLYKITNIGIERNLVGSPVVTLPENWTDDDLERAKQIVKNLRGNEFGGATLPPGFLLELFEGKRTLIDVLPYIEYQDTLISRSILAQFMNLGTKSGGSFALSKDQSDLFMMMLGACAKYICNVLNAYAIPQLINYNFASDLYPKLAFKPIGNDKLLSVLKMLVEGSIVVPDADLEVWARDMLELPEKSENEADIYLVGPQAKKKELEEQVVAREEASAQAERDAEKKDAADKVKDQAMKGDTAPKTKTEQASRVGTGKKVNATEDTMLWKHIKKTPEIEKVARKQLTDLVSRPLDSSTIAKTQIRFKEAMTNAVKERYLKEYDFEDKEKFLIKAAAIGNSISEQIREYFLQDYLAHETVDVDRILKMLDKGIFCI